MEERSQSPERAVITTQVTKTPCDYKHKRRMHVVNDDDGVENAALRTIMTTATVAAVATVAVFSSIFVLGPAKGKGKGDEAAAL